jgi:hypothetical protein
MNTNNWLRIFLTILAACLATVVLSTSTYAGEGHHGKGHKCPAYSDLDADGNGSVTAEEFYAFRAERMAARAAEGRKMKNAAKAPAFEELDLDGDKVLSAEEFAEHHASCPMMSKRDQEDRGKQ